MAVSSVQQLKSFRKEVDVFYARLDSVASAKTDDEIVNIFEWGDDIEQLEELSKVYSSLNSLYWLIICILDDISDPADYDGTED